MIIKQIIYIFLLQIFYIQKIYCQVDAFKQYQVGEWEFKDGQLNDSTSNQNTAIFYDEANRGTPKFGEDRFGNPNSSLLFSSTDPDQANKPLAIIEIDQEDSRYDIQNNWSVCMIIKGDKDDNYLNVAYQLYQNGGLYISFRRAGEFVVSLVPGNFVQGYDYDIFSDFVALTITYTDNLFYNVYLNGQRIITNLRKADFSFPKINIELGNTVGEKQLFDGRIDHLSIYNKSLSEFEISCIYYYPNCPQACESCNTQNNQLVCNSCRGDRIYIGGKCHCPSSKYDDFKSEFCQTTVVSTLAQQDNLLFYFNGESQYFNKYNADLSGQQSKFQVYFDIDGVNTRSYKCRYCVSTADEFGANNALSFPDNSVNYFELDSTYHYMNFGFNDLTICVKFQSLNTVHPQRMHIFGDSGGITIKVVQTKDRDSSSNYLPDIDINIGGSYIKTIENALDGNWHSLAITRFSGKYLQIYYDGVVSNYIVNNNDLTLKTSLFFGQVNDMPYYGNLDEIRVYHDFLLKEDLDAIFQFESGTHCPNECDGCSMDSGRVICTACRGNRVKDQYGLYCICQEGQTDIGQQDCVVYNHIIGYYPLDDEVRRVVDTVETQFFVDLSVYQNDIQNLVEGVFVDVVEDLQTPVIGKGTKYVQFNDANKSIGSQVFPKMYQKNLTVTFWGKMSTFKGQNQQVISINQSFQLTQFYQTSRLAVHRYGNSQFYSPSFTDSTWTYFTYTYNRETGNLVYYVNGEFVEEQYYDENFELIEQVGEQYNLVIGTEAPGGSEGPLDGSLKEVRFYDKILSTIEIKHLMAYPNCPDVCPDGCQLDDVNYTTKCTACKGNRVFDSQTYSCICPEGFEEVVGQENCQEIQDFVPSTVPLVYYSFDTSGVQDLIIQNQGINAVLFDLVTFSNGFDDVQGRAVQFQAEFKSFIEVQNTHLLQFGQQDFSISFWIKGSSESQYPWGTIFTNNQNYDGIKLNRYQNGSSIIFYIATDQVIIPDILNDQWNFIVIQRSLVNQITVIVNGSYIIQDYDFQTHEIISTNKLIFGVNEKLKLPFDGQIDEFKIFKYQISLEKAQELQDYRCKFECLECDYTSGGTECLQCRGDRILTGTDCLCPVGTYDDYTSTQCVICPITCKECNGPNDCTKCVDTDTDNAIREVNNVCKCPSQGYFDEIDLSNIFCQPCNNNRCLTCTDIQSCQQCVGTSPQFVAQRQESAICLCPYGYYDDSEGSSIDCLPCNFKTKFCEECNNLTGVCEKCEGDLVYSQESGKCVCPKGNHLIDLSNPEETNCEVCDVEKMVCPGENIIEIKQGFWRHNIESTTILDCFNNRDNCQGGTQSDLCKPGNTGALCESCDYYGPIRYAHTSDFECSECADDGSNELKIIGIIFMQLVLLQLNVGGTVQAIQDKIQFNYLKLLFNTGQPIPFEQGILMKIFQNYLYMAGAILTFQLELPSDLSKITSTTSSPSKIMAYSFDCILLAMQDYIPNVYFRIIWQFLVAFVELIIVCIIGKILIYFKKTNTNIRTIFWTTIIYQYISLQPAILSLLLDTMACREIDGVHYILNEPSLECYTNQYYSFTLLLCLPILIIWSMVIPLVMLGSIKYKVNSDLKRKRHLKQQKNRRVNAKMYDSHIIDSSFGTQSNVNEDEQKAVKIKQVYKLSPLEDSLNLQKYGYLYLEYTTRCWWWEFIKIFWRLVVALILSFYYNDVQVKAILIIITVVIYGILQNVYKPYKLYRQNRIDLIATFVIGMTLMIGLFLFENDYNYWFIIGVIIGGILNVVFLLTIFYGVLKAKARNYLVKFNEIKQKHDDIVAHKEATELKRKLDEELQSKLASKSANLTNTQEPQDKSLVQSKLKNFKKTQTIKIRNVDEEINNLQIDDEEIKVHDQTKEGYLLKIIDFIDSIGVKHFNKLDRQSLQIVKNIKLKLKKVTFLYVQGVINGIVQSLYEQEEDYMQDDNEKQFIFTSRQFLNGHVEQDQIDELEKQLKPHLALEKFREGAIQQFILQKLPKKLKELNFPKMYTATELCIVNQKQFEEVLKNSQNNVGISQSQRGINSTSQTQNYICQKDQVKVNYQENVKDKNNDNKQNMVISNRQDKLQEPQNSGEQQGEYPSFAQNKDNNIQIEQIVQSGNQKSQISQNGNQKNDIITNGQELENNDDIESMGLDLDIYSENNQQQIMMSTRKTKADLDLLSERNQLKSARLPYDSNNNNYDLNDSPSSQFQSNFRLNNKEEANENQIEPQNRGENNNSQIQKEGLKDEDLKIEIYENNGGQTDRCYNKTDKEDIEVQDNTPSNELQEDFQEKGQFDEEVQSSVSTYQHDEQIQLTEDELKDFEEIADEMFNQIKNNELQQYLICFKLLENNKNKGTIEKKFVTQTAKKLGIDVQLRKLKTVFNELNSKQEIDFCNFCARLIFSKYHKNPKEEIETIFARFMDLSSGNIASQQLKDLCLILLKEDQPEIIYKEMINQEDRNNDQNLGISEFIHLVV